MVSDDASPQRGWRSLLCGSSGPPAAPELAKDPRAAELRKCIRHEVGVEPIEHLYAGLYSILKLRLKQRGAAVLPITSGILVVSAKGDDHNIAQVSHTTKFRED